MGELPKPKLVLFDLDGTLLDTHDLILDSMQYATRKVLECIVPDEELMCMVGQPLDLQMEVLARDYGRPELFVTSEAVKNGAGRGLPKYDEAKLATELTSVYRAYNEAIHDEKVRAFDGVPEMLLALEQAGVRMGVVTSKRHALAVRGLECCGIESFFQLVIGPDDWSDAKPHPGGIVRAMCELGVLPADVAAAFTPSMTPADVAVLVGDVSRDVWYVGDSPFDLQAGNGAGCFTVAALWGMFARDLLEAQQPNVFCESPREITEL